MTVCHWTRLGRCNRLQSAPEMWDRPACYCVCMHVMYGWRRTLFEARLAESANVHKDVAIIPHVRVQLLCAS